MLAGFLGQLPNVRKVSLAGASLGDGAAWSRVLDALGGGAAALEEIDLSGVAALDDAVALVAALTPKVRRWFFLPPRPRDVVFSRMGSRCDHRALSSPRPARCARSAIRHDVAHVDLVSERLRRNTVATRPARCARST